MNQPLPPNEPEKDKPEKKPAKSLEDLLRQSQSRIDAIPSEFRIPPIPPSDQASEEVKQYVKNKMKLPLATSITNLIFVANEALERAKIREGRIGKLGGMNVFAFLYPYGMKFRTICVYPADGINPFMVAKSIMWGFVEEIPLGVAHSETKEMDVLFKLETVDFKSLMDNHILNVYKRAYAITADTAYWKERKEKEALKFENGKLTRELDKKTRIIETLTSSVSKADDQIIRWQITAIALLALLLPCGFLVVRMNW